MTTTSAKPRVPRGVSTGGEFTHRQRSDGSLGAAVFTAVNGKDKITARDALRVAQYYAAKDGKNKTRLTRSDRDDIVQDVMEEMLRRYGHFTPGLVKSAIGTAQARVFLAKDGIRHEDASARKKLEERIDRRTQVLGRDLSEREVSDLAESIRDGWPDQRHKPSPTFYRVSVKKEILVEPEVFDRMPAPERSEETYGSVAELDAAVTAGLVNKREARRMFWNAYATEQNLPPVAAGSINQVTYKRLMAISGDVDTMAQAYLSGRPVGDEIFAPFAVTSREGRVAVASELVGSRGRLLWGAAVDAARIR